LLWYIISSAVVVRVHFRRRIHFRRTGHPQKFVSVYVGPLVLGIIRYISTCKGLLWITINCWKWQLHHLLYPTIDVQGLDFIEGSYKIVRIRNWSRDRVITSRRWLQLATVSRQNNSVNKMLILNCTSVLAVLSLHVFCLIFCLCTFTYVNPIEFCWD